jgi:hypothetical protein
MTLLHVLIGTVRREFPSVLDFVDDLKDVGSAARSTGAQKKKQTDLAELLIILFFVSNG